MINWPGIKSMISSQVIEFSGLDTTKVRWVDEPSGDLFGKIPVVYLRISSIVQNGIPEEQRVSNGRDDLTVTMYGQRDFTLSIRCESFTQDISDPLYAGNILEAIKIRMKRSSSVEQRRGLFSLTDYMPTKWFQYVADGRIVNTFVTDFKCSTVDIDIDDSTGSGLWIGEALVDGTINDPRGDTISSISEDINTIS